MKELYTLLPGGDLWEPYLEQSPVSPTELVDHPLKTLRGFSRRSWGTCCGRRSAAMRRCCCF